MAHQYHRRDDQASSVATKTGDPAKPPISGKQLGESIRKAYDLVCFFAVISVTLMILEVELITASIVDIGYVKVVGTVGTVGLIARDGAHASSPPQLISREISERLRVVTELLPSWSSRCPDWMEDVETTVDTTRCTLTSSADFGVTAGTCADADATATCAYVPGSYSASVANGALDTIDTADSCTSTTGESCGHAKNTGTMRYLKLCLFWTMILQALAYFRYDKFYYEYQVRDHASSRQPLSLRFLPLAFALFWSHARSNVVDERTVAKGRSESDG